MNWIHEPFVRVALPVVVTLILAVFVQNTHFDDVNRRFDDMEKRIPETIRRLKRIEAKLGITNRALLFSKIVLPGSEYRKTRVLNGFGGSMTWDHIVGLCRGQPLTNG
jgi:hypothetical protein